MQNEIGLSRFGVAAQAVADFLHVAIASRIPETRCGYDHMGATLTDTVLQAGLNYRSVVLPRVNHILTTYPYAVTTSGFWQLACEIGPGELLRWSHPEKINRLICLIEVLRS